MIWQDTVIASGSLLFALSLYFSIASKNKPELRTCVIQVATRVVMGITFATLGLWMTVGACVLMGTGWTILLIQQMFRIGKA
ncbi:hypothetical protein ACFLYF_05105 [Chloroflexota bacterium]